MSEDFKEIVSKAYINCDMKKPLEADDPRWVDLDQAGVRGDKSCLSELSRNIKIFDQQGESSCLLFSGFSGGGKSTVLKQLQDDLNKSKFDVIYVDAEEYLNLRMPLEPYEILLAIAGEIDKRLESPGKNIKRFWERIQNFFGSEVEVSEFKLKLPEVAEFQLNLKQNPDFRTGIQKLVDKKQLESSLIEQCHQFITEYQAQFRRDNPDKKNMVIIVDSLEKIRSPEGETAIRESLKRAFTIYSDSFRMPCHSIYTVPPWLRFTPEWPTISTTFDDNFTLPMVKVWNPKKNEPYQKGVNVLLSMINERMNVQEIFGEAGEGYLKEVIRLTGGYPRDLLRVVQGILGNAYDLESGPISKDKLADFVDMELVDLAEDYHNALYYEDVAQLMEVEKNKSIPDMKIESPELLPDWLEHHFIICYRNRDTWYDVHPILTERSDRYKKLKDKILAKNDSPT